MPNIAVDAHDARALEHYNSLIAARFPPHLAAALAAARYQSAISAAGAAPPLPVLREIVSATKESRPELRRTAGRLLVEVEAAMGITR